MYISVKRYDKQFCISYFELRVQQLDSLACNVDKVHFLLSKFCRNTLFNSCAAKNKSFILDSKNTVNIRLGIAYNFEYLFS